MVVKGFRKTGANKDRAIREVVGKIPNEYVECRDLGHAWRDHRVESLKGGFVQTLICQRCPVQKERVLNRHGDQVQHPKYIYPEGYVVKGLGFLSHDERSEVRLRAVQQKIARGNSRTTR